MTEIETLQTSIGRAVVLHRLALAIECRDALSDRPTNTSVGVRYRRLPSATNPNPPWRPRREPGVVDVADPLRGPGRALGGAGTVAGLAAVGAAGVGVQLSRNGSGQFTLRHVIPDDPLRPLPQLELVVDDPSRRYVPRRFTVTPWTYAAVREPAPFVVGRARLLRLWLRPGSAYAFPRTHTMVRGRIALADGTPVRWARVEGTTPTSVAGWAHADERGEFVLPVTDPGYDPIRDFPRNLVVTLVVTADSAARKPDPKDRAADLVSEVIPRSSNPPSDAELDNEVLRGTALPPGYVPNTATARQVTVPVGAAVNLTEDVVFAP